MKPFNNELQVGQPAMIIGCYKPANSWAIGKIVVVECLMGSFEEVPEQYKISDDIILMSIEKSAIISGINTDERIIANHASIMLKHLMPLPPLPPLGDVYDDEMFDVMENLKIHS